MIKQLRKVGNSNALILDKALLELVGLKEQGSVQLTVANGSLIVTPVDHSPNEADADILAGQVKMFDNPDEMLSSLTKPW